MKSLIITVAGLSSRFSASLGTTVLKCIYNNGRPQDSLLYQLVSQANDFDSLIIVGGFKYDELCNFVHQELSAYTHKITLLNNDHYSDFGSGYSLKLGLAEAIRQNATEIVFAEGDLFVDSESFQKVCKSAKSVITCNTEPIMANKAVAFYYDLNNQIHYIFDTAHNSLSVNEPFLGIFNSAQIWKFTDPELTKKSFAALTDMDWQGTNLVFIEKYFSALKKEDYELIQFKKWINCNTIDDYRKSQEVK